MNEIESLYEILQIDKSADTKEIKKAYIKMLRKYPPEKAPEEFKKIREAYERLSDSISRAEYDAFSQYKDLIDEYTKTGDESLENKDYKSAIKAYKKILVIEPNLSFAKNKLGLALAYDEQYDLAIVQFEQLIKINPDNATYYSNLGYVYKDKLEYDKAEAAWLNAHKIDPINDNIILELSELYITQENYIQAINFLRNCLGKNKEDDFQDFIYYFEMVKVYTFSNNISGIEAVIDEIENIIPDVKEDKAYVAWKFGKLAFELFEAKIYDLASKISKRALEIDDGNEAIGNLYNSATELAEGKRLINLLMEDESVMTQIKGPVFYYFYSDEYSEEEFKDNCDKNLEAILSYIKTEYESIIDSINILKRKYNILYKYKQELYDEIYRRAQQIKTSDEQWNRFRDDSRITNSIKRLIELWMLEDLSDEKRNNYFNNIMEEMDHENYNDIIRSIDIIRGGYSELYKLNSETLDKIRSFAKENSTTKSTQSTTSNLGYNNNLNKSKNTNSDSSNSGCAIMFICAVIGAFIIPGFGFFIGAFIGGYISEKL